MFCAVLHLAHVSCYKDFMSMVEEFVMKQSCRTRAHLSTHSSMFWCQTHWFSFSCRSLLWVIVLFLGRNTCMKTDRLLHHYCSPISACDCFWSANLCWLGECAFHHHSGHAIIRNSVTSFTLLYFIVLNITYSFCFDRIIGEVIIITLFKVIALYCLHKLKFSFIRISPNNKST